MLPYNYQRFQFRAHEVWSLVTQRWLYGVFPQSEAWAAPFVIFALLALGALLVVTQ